MRSSAQPPTVSVTPLHGIIAAKLLRLPAIRNIDAERLLSAADALQKTDFDLGYSLLCRLANCVTPRFRNFARKILAKNETQDNWLINGAFCSELVAKYYALLELPLFNQVWEPHTISPNDLDRSHLVEVKGAILLQLDLNTQTSASHAAEKQPLRRPKVNNVAHTRSYVRDMARWNSMNIIVDRKSTGLFNQASSAVIKGRADLLESYKAFAQNVNAAIAFAKDNGDETNLDKVFDYADAATLVHVLTAEVVRRNAVLHSTEKPPDQVCAEDMVAELASRLYRQVSYNFQSYLCFDVDTECAPRDH